MCPGGLCQCAQGACLCARVGFNVYVPRGALSMRTGCSPCAQGALSMCAGCTVHVRAQGALSMCARRVHCPCARAGCIVHVRAQGRTQGGTIYVHRGAPSICTKTLCRTPLHPHSPPPLSPYLLHNHRHMHKVDNVHVNSFPFPPPPFFIHPLLSTDTKAPSLYSAVAIHQF